MTATDEPYEQEKFDGAFNELLRKVFSLEELKVEILLFFAELQITPLEIFTIAQNYLLFCGLLYLYLQDKPVRFPGPPFKKNKQAKVVHERILDKAKKLNREHMMVIQIKVIVFTEGIAKGRALEFKMASGPPWVFANI